MAGCGGEEASAPAGTTATTMSGDKWAKRADELCQQVSAELLELDIQHKGQEILSGGGPQAEKLNRVADLLEVQLAAVSEFRGKVEALGRPQTGGEDVDMILEKTRSAEDELAKAISALRDGEEQEFAEAMQRYAGYSRQSASIARDSELNFAICGTGA
jgi:hypothetical protein